MRRRLVGVLVGLLVVLPAAGVSVAARAAEMSFWPGAVQCGTTSVSVTLPLWVPLGSTAIAMVSVDTTATVTGGPGTYTSDAAVSSTGAGVLVTSALLHHTVIAGEPGTAQTFTISVAGKLLCAWLNVLVDSGSPILDGSPVTTARAQGTAQPMPGGTISGGAESWVFSFMTVNATTAGLAMATTTGTNWQGISNMANNTDFEGRPYWFHSGNANAPITASYSNNSGTPGSASVLASFNVAVAGCTSASPCVVNLGNDATTLPEIRDWVAVVAGVILGCVLGLLIYHGVVRRIF